MTYADSAPLALEITAACAVVALLTRVLTKDGAVAAFVVGACVSVGFGLPGLAVLGTFFVVGTLATRIGWATKKARGTAEAGEGRRDWKRVLGKGGVAAACGLIAFASPQDSTGLWVAVLGFPGAVAAALADTLGTEIGTLFSREPRALPTFQRVPTGTAGAVSSAGLLAGAVGGLAVGIAWSAAFADGGPSLNYVAGAIGIAGLVASLVESLAVGLGLRAPGFVRNVLTTVVGAALTAGFFFAISNPGFRR